jgi:hypothetical protein
MTLRYTKARRSQQGFGSGEDLLDCYKIKIDI